MKALVTGAGGMIGSNLTARLLERGDEVRGLLMPDEPDPGLGERGMEVVRGDITRPETLRGISRDRDTVFHLAGRVEEWGWRSMFREAHYDGTRNMLNECAGNVGRFVYFSSVSYYGKGEQCGYTEEAEPVPSGLPYPDMKLLCERLVRLYGAERGLEYTIIRPTNVIGPRSAHVRNVVDSYLRGPVPLVEGGSYSASFVYLDNLVDGVLLAADSPKAVDRAYHFCDDYEVTWRDYFEAVGDLLGKRPLLSLSFRQAYWLATLIEYAYMPFKNKRPLFTRYAVTIIGEEKHLDCTRAREELGWKTRVPWEQAWSEIENWIKENYDVGVVAPAVTGTGTGASTEARTGDRGDNGRAF